VILDDLLAPVKLKDLHRGLPRSTRPL